MILFVFLVALVTHEVAGLEGHAVGFEQAGHAFVDTAFGLAGLAVALLVVVTGLGVGGDDTLEVAQNDLLRTLGNRWA